MDEMRVILENLCSGMKRKKRKEERLGERVAIVKNDRTFFSDFWNFSSEI